MTVHLAHASRAEASYNTSGDLALTPTADGVLAVQGQQAIVPRPMRLVGAWAAGSDLFPNAANAVFTDVRIESPAYAELNPASIRTISPLASGIADNALGVTDMACEPLPLRAGDPLSVTATVLEGTGSSNLEVHALLWLADGCDPIPDAPSLWVEFEVVTVPSTQGAWSAVSIRFRRPLPGRKFAILGLDYVQAGALAARLALPGSALKPGVPARQTIGERRARLFDSMHLGVLGTFDGFAPPTLEVLIPSTATAGTAARGWMRVAPLDAVGSGKSGGCGCGGAGCGGSSCSCGR